MYLELSSFSSSFHAYSLLLDALYLIPLWHYIFALLVISVVFLYRFLEFHLLQDAFTGFRGGRVKLIYGSGSRIYHDVASKCRVLHGRFLATPWLSSPHLQTCFLQFFGRPPVFNYRRQIFNTSDGGTIALDWVLASHVSTSSFSKHNGNLKDDTTPIAVVVPGLTSDSAATYLKHLAFNMSKSGWDVVVSNHRGLGGVSVTSDCFYNAGWTEDLRVILDYLHKEYPRAPLFAIGTSIGANILVKHLGEEREKTPVAGAVAVCSPWDLLANSLAWFYTSSNDGLMIGDRFICRRLIQKLYGRALTIGLQGYAQLHEALYSKLANWEGIKKSRSIRDFDNHATCLVGKFETVDTYYRRCSSSPYVGSVSVPLLCISALDDPLCSIEVIPWDECRANNNVVLATTQHGGHLAFFEGLTASSLWWVRATVEFLGVLRCSKHMHVQDKIQNSQSHPPAGSSIDQGPYVSIAEGGMVAAMGNDQEQADAVVEHTDQSENQTEPISEDIPNIVDRSAVTKCLNQLCRKSSRSIWLLAYIAILTSFPVLSSVFSFVFRKKRSSGMPRQFPKT